MSILPSIVQNLSNHLKKVHKITHSRSSVPKVNKRNLINDLWKLENFSKETGNHLKEFEDWQLTPDGGKARPLTAKKHATQMCFIINYLKPKCYDDLCSDGAILNMVDARVNNGEWQASTG